MQTALAVDGTPWVPGELVGLYVQPDVGDPRIYPIAANVEDMIWVWGDLPTALGVADGDTFVLRDLRLGVGSPCIDAADGSAAPETDILGNPRMDDSDVIDSGGGSPTYADMGAYERQP